MAFERLGAQTPVAIADISVELYYPEPDTGASPGASYSVQVRYSDGARRVVTGDLVPHLTQGQIAALMSFMADMRVLAIAQILPEQP